VVDMDLEKYFDTVNQSKLIQILSETIKDGRVISLIHRYLRAGIMVEGLFEESSEGVPQGGPLSPLLGNVMLNEWNCELDRRGHRFVRYADDGKSTLFRTFLKRHQLKIALGTGSTILTG